MVSVFTSLLENIICRAPPLLIPALSLFCGILMGGAIGMNPTRLCLGFTVFLCLLIPGVAGKCSTKPAMGWFFLLTGFILISRVLYPVFPPDHISCFVDKGKALMSGTIASFPESTDRTTRYRLCVNSLVTGNGPPVKTTGCIRLTVYGQGCDLPYGSTITFLGSIRSIRNFKNPHGFDYERHLALQGIYGSTWVNADDVDIQAEPAVSPGLPVRFMQWFLKYRRTFSTHILDALGDGDAARLMAALIIGEKKEVSPEINHVFACTGLRHLLAISGFHLSAVAGLAYYIGYSLLSRWSFLLSSGHARKVASLSALIPVTAFAVLSGFSPSAQRALVMIFLVMIAVALEREADISNSLCGAGIVILLMDPGAVFSVSFQLSFCAMAGIILGLRLVNRFRSVCSNRIAAYALNAVIVSFSIVVVTQPIILLYFNMIVIPGPLINLVVMPVFGFLVIPLGLGSLVVFPLLPGLSFLFLRLSGYLIDALLPGLSAIASWPFVWMRCVTPDGLDIAGYYILVAGIVTLLLSRCRVFAFGSIFFALVLLLISSFQSINSRCLNDGLTITVLDVGQGNAALIELPGGRRVLVDGGGFSGTTAFDTGAFIVAPFLWKKKIMTLDAVIATHPETDHMKGLVFIAENFKIRRLITNGDTRDTPWYSMLMNALENQGTRMESIPGLSEPLEYGDCRFEFFHPEESSSEPTSSNRNDRSIVFRIVFNDFSMLFPGDIGCSVERNLTYELEKRLCSNVMLVPHHGSSRSSSQFFLDIVSPESVIVSCGWKNRFGFPQAAVINRYSRSGARIFRTDQSGAICLRSDGRGYTITTFNGD